MTTYMLTDATDGTEICDGLETEETARVAALRHVARTGYGVCVCAPDGGEKTFGLPSASKLARLQVEAGEAGDTEQVDLCRRAIAGDESAYRECAKVLAANALG